MATYQALQLVGRGGMGEVWRGKMVTDGGASRPVALKFILPHLASDAALLSMFRAEAQLSMRLSHGNVVQVFDFAQLEGRWFLAMEWVDGTSLWRVLQKAKLQKLGAVHPVMAAQLLVPVLEGLHHAHTRVEPDGKPLRLVHRDVSPDNVLVSWDGQVKVADFGLAHTAVAGRRETQPGIFKGKLAYGAPEQARAEPVDARADVYAAGVMLWELVTGENPVAAIALEIATGRARLPPFPAARVDAAFAALVDRAVAPRPGGRFQSAKEFRAALTAWLASQPSTRAGPAELMAWLFPENVAAPEAKAAGVSTGDWLLKWKPAGEAPAAPPAASEPMPPVERAALIGRWRLALDDLAARRRYGEHALELTAHGDLVQSTVTPGGLTRVLLTWRLEGDVLVTDQPSAPHVERQKVTALPNGQLMLGEGLEASRYQRDDDTFGLDPEARVFALAGTALRHAVASAGKGGPFVPFLMTQTDTEMSLLRINQPSADLAERAGRAQAGQLLRSVTLCAWTTDGLLALDGAQTDAAFTAVSRRGVRKSKVLALRYRFDADGVARSFGGFVVVGEADGWLP